MFIEHTDTGDTHFYEIKSITIKSSGTEVLYGEVGTGGESTIGVPEEVIEGDTETSVIAWLTGPQGLFNGGIYMSEADYLLRVAKRSKLAEIKARRIELEEGGLPTSFGVVDSDPDSQRKVSGGVQMALISLNPDLSTLHFPEGLDIIWRFSDNTTRPMTAQEMIQMGVEVGKQVAQCQMVKNYFDGLVGAATTVSEVEAIDVQVNWLAIDLTPAA